MRVEVLLGSDEVNGAIMCRKTGASSDSDPENFTWSYFNLKSIGCEAGIEIILM